MTKQAKKFIGTYVDESDHRRFAAMAKKNHRTIAGQITYLIEKALSDRPTTHTTPKGGAK